MNSNLIYQKRDDIVTRKIAGETLLIPICTQMADIQNIFVLNDVGEYIWQHLDGKKNIKEIHRGILSTFNAEKEQTDSDIREFIIQLFEANLIQEVNEGRKNGM